MRGSSPSVAIGSLRLARRGNCFLDFDVNFVGSFPAISLCMQVACLSLSEGQGSMVDGHKQTTIEESFC